MERLAQSTGVDSCGGNHWRGHVSHIQANQPVPEWPPSGVPSHCACGAEIDYRHIVHEYWPSYAV